jgi:hypothetical protein
VQVNGLRKEGGNLEKAINSKRAIDTPHQTRGEETKTLLGRSVGRAAGKPEDGMKFRIFENNSERRS